MITEAAFTSSRNGKGDRGFFWRRWRRNGCLVVLRVGEGKDHVVLETDS